MSSRRGSVIERLPSARGPSAPERPDDGAVWRLLRDGRSSSSSRRRSGRADERGLVSRAHTGPCVAHDEALRAAERRAPDGRRLPRCRSRPRQLDVDSSKGVRGARPRDHSGRPPRGDARAVRFRAASDPCRYASSAPSGRGGDILACFSSGALPTGRGSLTSGRVGVPIGVSSSQVNLMDEVVEVQLEGGRREIRHVGELPAVRRPSLPSSPYSREAALVTAVARIPTSAEETRSSTKRRASIVEGVAEAVHGRRRPPKGDEERARHVGLVVLDAAPSRAQLGRHAERLGELLDVAHAGGGCEEAALGMRRARKSFGMSSRSGRGRRRREARRLIPPSSRPMRRGRGARVLDAVEALPTTRGPSTTDRLRRRRGRR